MSAIQYNGLEKSLVPWYEVTPVPSPPVSVIAAETPDWRRAVVCLGHLGPN